MPGCWESINATFIQLPQKTLGYTEVIAFQGVGACVVELQHDDISAIPGWMVPAQ